MGEDVEDQAGAIEDPALEVPLQVAFLGRREGMGKDHQLRLTALHQQLELIGLAAADEEARIRLITAARQFTDDLGPSGPGEEAKFLALLGLHDPPQVQMDQDGPFPGTRAVKHADRRATGDRGKGCSGPAIGDRDRQGR